MAKPPIVTLTCEHCGKPQQFYTEVPAPEIGIYGFTCILVNLPWRECQCEFLSDELEDIEHRAEDVAREMFVS